MGDEAVTAENSGELPSKQIAGTVRRHPSKRFSVVAAEGNPLSNFAAGAKVASSKTVQIKVENTADAHNITSSELSEFIDKLKLIEDNAGVISFIESSKVEYLYSSSDLLSILDCITSLKTKMAAIESIAPRLTDPKKHQQEFIDIFRFVTDREKVEGILKVRVQQLSGGIFKRTDSSSSGVGSPSKSPSSARTGSGRGMMAGRGNGSFRAIHNTASDSSGAESSNTSAETAATTVFGTAINHSLASMTITESQNEESEEHGSSTV